MNILDCLVIGGGPAGLQAALTLARAKRTVAVVDSGHPRNAVSRRLSGFLTRDGIAPSELLRIAGEDLGRYPGVVYIPAKATGAVKFGGGFQVDYGGAESIRSRKLLLATGVTDCVPDVPGAASIYGKLLHCCPFCDGWEYRDRRIAVLGSSGRGYRLARFMLNWTSDVSLLCSGRPPIPRMITELQRLGVEVYRGTAWAFSETTDGRVDVTFRPRSGAGQLRFDGIFFNTPSFGNSALAESLGCQTGRDGAVKVNKHGQTTVRGVFAAGNLLRDVMLSIVAAGQGATAAFAIVNELTEDDTG